MCALNLTKEYQLIVGSCAVQREKEHARESNLEMFTPLLSISLPEPRWWHPMHCSLWLQWYLTIDLSLHVEQLFMMLYTYKNSNWWVGLTLHFHMSPLRRQESGRSCDVEAMWITLSASDTVLSIVCILCNVFWTWRTNSTQSQSLRIASIQVFHSTSPSLTFV